MKRSEELNINIRLFTLIKEKGFTEYHTLMDYLLLNGTEDEYDIAMKNVVAFDEILKSYRRIKSKNTPQ